MSKQLWFKPGRAVGGHIPWGAITVVPGQFVKERIYFRRQQEDCLDEFCPSLRCKQNTALHETRDGNRPAVLPGMDADFLAPLSAVLSRKCTTGESDSADPTTDGVVRGASAILDHVRFGGSSNFGQRRIDDGLVAGMLETSGITSAGSLGVGNTSKHTAINTGGTASTRSRSLKPSYCINFSRTREGLGQQIVGLSWSRVLVPMGTGLKPTTSYEYKGHKELRV
ncbi:hypothetical protein DFH09DRAFT_1092826 [Mycena vulgaris]|nr:hypothetical protein DFH09DRAFT_1092826 [Mycena vulgaris]